MSPALLLLPLAVANPPARPSCELCRPARVAPMPPQYGPNFPPPDTAPGLPCPPVGPPAPLLAVQVTAPDGVSVTAVLGSRAFPAPAVFGFRPGYAYRLELALPTGAKLYPTLEVRGSIVPRAGLLYMDYPLTVPVTATDLARAQAGGVVTKVAYLEDPRKAIPVAARSAEPLEQTDLSVEQAITEATANGRPVAVWRLGDRVPSADELARMSVPNTVLLPGELALAAPAGPPHFPWCGVPWYDPIIGAKPPTEECITDGGDFGPRLGIGPNGRLGGLDVTDVAAEFTLRGRRRVTTTNVVCVCVPRFVLRRVDLAPGGVHAPSGLDINAQVVPAKSNTQVVPALMLTEREKAVAFVGRSRAALTVVVNGVLEVVGLSRPQGLGLVAGVAQAVVVVEPAEISTPGDLVVTKEVSPAAGVRQGEEVTFTLRYRNGTHDPVTDLVLTDSLSGRLEYVPGSVQRDRPADVTTRPNDAGGTVVRFDIPGPIPPGGYGVVTFRARVR